MKVFLAGTSFLPNYGGPAFSVSRLAQALSDAGVSVGLWAPDGSTVSASSATNTLRNVTCLTGAASQALERFGHPDVMHDNGIWLPHNHHLAKLARRRGIPRLVSLRGMIEPWALNYRRWKKKVAWALYQRQDLKRAQYHHATADDEAGHLQHLGLGVPICVVPNGMDVPPRSRCRLSTDRHGTEKVALFLSRIHPKKGLPMLLEAWAALRPAGWVLHIAGPDEGGHLAEVKALSQRLDIEETVRFLGPVDGEELSSVYEASDLFILPTHSENFGMVVAEALAHGLPVLTTKGAPWAVLQDHNCGWWVDVSAEGIAAGLRQAIACDGRELQEMGVRGRALVEKNYAWNGISKRLMSVYEDMLAR